MEDSKEIQELLHRLVNKSVSIQGLLKLLERTDLNDKQKELVQKSKVVTEESIQTIKEMREALRD